jgi:hypothetical protein
VHPTTSLFAMARMLALILEMNKVETKTTTMKPLFFGSLLLLAVSCDHSNSTESTTIKEDTVIPLDTPAAPADNTQTHEEGVNEESNQ